MVINNYSELQKLLDNSIQYVLQKIQQDIYDIIEEFILQYYNESVFNGTNVPKKYFRTYQFLNSLVKSSIVKSNNTYTIEVYIDTNSLNYSISGQKVVEWANNKSHGGIVKGDLRVFDDSVEFITNNKKITKAFISYLKELGITVK